MSMASDGGVLQQHFKGNPIYRMEFCNLNSRTFLGAQNLFAVVSLYAVNPRNTAVIQLIREFLIKKDDLIRGLESLSSQPG